MGDNKQMYFWLMLSDLIVTAVLEIMAQSGAREGDVTKEMWLEISKANVERRKNAITALKNS